MREAAFGYQNFVWANSSLRRLSDTDLGLTDVVRPVSMDETARDLSGHVVERIESATAAFSPLIQVGCIAATGVNLSMCRLGEGADTSATPVFIREAPAKDNVYWVSLLLEQISESGLTPSLPHVSASPACHLPAVGGSYKRYVSSVVAPIASGSQHQTALLRLTGWASRRSRNAVWLTDEIRSVLTDNGRNEQAVEDFFLLMNEVVTRFEGCDINTTTHTDPEEGWRKVAIDVDARSMSVEDAMSHEADLFDAIERSPDMRRAARRSIITLL